MTRIAFVSDMHGNLPGFEAVLAEVERLGPFDAVVGGGDFALGGAYPEECVQRVRDLGWSCVLGNTDEWIVEAARGSRNADWHYPDHMAPNPGQLADARWCAGRLAADDVDFLAGLPLAWTTSGPSGKRLAFVHATPWSPHPFVRPDGDESTFRRMLDESGADTLLYGHVHYPFLKEIGNRQIGCVGSAGIPFDGDERPCFAIATDDGDGWSVEHVRIAYDREAYLAVLTRSETPGAENWAAVIRAAKLPG